MRRIFLLTLLSAGALIAFTAVPAALFDSGTAGLEASAGSTINSTKSNTFRQKHNPPPPKSGAGPRGGDPAGLSASPGFVRIPESSPILNND
jgi:hypothetical protein